MTMPAYKLVATWFGVGLMKPAPGTWGSLAALPFAILIQLAGGWVALAAAAVLVSCIGVWAANLWEKETGDKDASPIVIDEVAGMWITLVAVPLSGVSLVVGFLLFRFFDVIKPWPISWLDKNLPGGYGVMADDIVAGIAAGAVLWGLHHYAVIG